MMKKESLLHFVLRLTLTLLLITGVVAAALACVNAITKDAIAANQEEKTQAALKQVLPDAGTLEKMTLTGDTGIVREVYVSGNSYAVKVAPNGFGGEVNLMVGIADGKVTGISVISHAETPGLGAVAGANNAKGEAFRGQFVGTSGELVLGQQVDAMSGATITSTAVVTGVNAALRFVETLG